MHSNPTHANPSLKALPRVDRTSTSTSSYWVGGPNGAGGEFATSAEGARLLHARQDGQGNWTALDGAEEVRDYDAQVLLGYLEGPRRLHLRITLLGRTAREDAVVHTQDLTVFTRRDPNDRQAWAAFTRTLALSWLAVRQTPKGHFAALALDLSAVRCGGPWGLWDLGYVKVRLP
ncbi:hypothetical protein [Streptomyces sp. NPDC002952]|uniref:hypothetical protein n=1 Tax=Streptomyces sp. NPDC002952 TaxID=3364673 RepID=UPI0036CE0C26